MVLLLPIVYCCLLLEDMGYVKKKSRCRLNQMFELLFKATHKREKLAGGKDSNKS